MVSGAWCVVRGAGMAKSFLADIFAYLYSMTAIVAIDRGVIRYYGMGVVIGIVILAVLAIFPGTWSRSPFFFVLLGLAGCEASWWLTTAQLESITQF